MLAGEATAVAVGQLHTCALLTTKQLRCWGSNNGGPIGLGYATAIGNDEHPTAVPPLPFTDVEKVVAGTYHTCLLRAGGDVHCFGSNDGGQLGLGHTNDIGDTESPDVGPVALGGPAIDVTAGSSHTCAVLLGGDVRCWGYGPKGQLGLGHTMTIGDDELPTAVPPVQLGAPAVSISASLRHTCAVLADGRLRCWGEGSYGALGYANQAVIGDDEHPEVAGDVQVF